MVVDNGQLGVEASENAAESRASQHYGVGAVFRNGVETGWLLERYLCQRGAITQRSTHCLTTQR
jgi:hypothetical protein